VPLRELSDEFQDVNAVRSLQGSVATMVLKPGEQLASIAQVLGAARGNEPAYVAQVLTVAVKSTIEEIIGVGADCPWHHHPLITKMLPKMLHYRGSILEDSMGGEFLFDKSLDQTLIDLCSSLDMDCSGEVIEPAHEAENALSAAPRETKPTQPTGQSVDVLGKWLLAQVPQMPS